MAPDSEEPSDESVKRAPVEVAAPSRRGRGCLRGIFRTTRTSIAIALIILVAAWLWLETSSAGEVLGDRISIALEDGLGRDVAVGRVSIWPTIPPRIVVRDIRIANLPGASKADFAHVGRIEISGIIRSLIERRVDLGTIRIFDAAVSIEKMPAAAGGGFNLPSWKSDKESEPPKVDIRRILVRRAAVEFIDRDQGVNVQLSSIDSELRPGKKLESLKATVKSGELRLAAGKVSLPLMMVMAEVSADRNALSIESLDATSEALQVGARGSVAFVKLGAVDIAANVRGDLARLSVPLGLPRDITMDGRVVSAFTVRGRESIELAGTFHSGAARYDRYKAEKIDGRFRVGGGAYEVALDKARFAGGDARVSLTIPAGDAENVFAVEHGGVRVEQLLGVWGIGSSGLMGHADGKLDYRWRGKDVLAGRGEGTAEIEVERDGTTRALYAVPVEGSARYRLENRKLIFEPLKIETGATTATITGGFALETLAASIDADVRARDIRELDRITADIARSLGEKDWRLFGLAGDGAIRAQLGGTLKRPVVDGKLVANGFTWAGVELGHADVDLRYDAAESRIHFRRAQFKADGGTITVRDDIGLPRGGEPAFSLTIDAIRYPAKRALDAVGLALPVRGAATGGLRVTGKPSRGTVLFESLEVVDAGSRASIDGMLGWTPEQKGIELECRIGLQNLPVSKVYAFFSDTGKPPVDGTLTGTMSLEGKLVGLQGRGSVALRGAVIAGEPIELATAEIEFASGSMHVREFTVQLAAGRFEGEFSYDIAAERFEYVVHSPGIALAKLKGWPELESTLDGTLVVTSSGVGDIQHPELVVDVRLEGARFLGFEPEPDAKPTTLFVAIKPQGFTVQGQLGKVAEISGSGTVNAASGELFGSVRARIDAGAPILVALSKQYDLQTSGGATLELDVHGVKGDFANASVNGRLVDVDVALGHHRIGAPREASFSLRNGVLELSHFELLFDDAPLRVVGALSFAENRANLGIDGTVSAELLNYMIPDFRMRGAINLAIRVDGELDAPKVSGTAEMRGGEIRIPDILQPFKDVNASLVLRDRGVKIDAFSATVGSGRIVAGGSIDRDAKGRSQLRVSVRGTDLSVRVTPSVTVGGDCDLIVTGDIAEKIRINGNVDLNKALYTKKVDINAALTDMFLDRKLTVDPIAAPWQNDVLLGLDVNFAPRAIAVRNNLAQLTGTGELRITGTLGRPIAVGRIVVDEGGSFELRDVEYRIARGSIDFQNPFRTDPYIDISAEGRYQNEYDVTVSLTGTLDRLETTVTSDPPVEDLSLLSLLGGGLAQQDSSAPGSASSAFTDARNTLVDASVGGVLSSTVPFADSVRIEGLATEKPRVTLDKALSRELRAIVTYTLDEKGEDIEIIEWRVSDNLVLQFTRDSTKDSSFLINAIDLTFRRRFRGQW